MFSRRTEIKLQTNLFKFVSDEFCGTRANNLIASGVEHFYQMKEMAAEGTLRPETKCWAQGMDGWRPLQSISQLKWYLLATGTAVMNETDLAVLILNMLIKMCEFYPNRLALKKESCEHLDINC